jgi:predicted nucleic acid-binding protein
MSSKVLPDTNILIYASYAGSPYLEKCQKIFDGRHELFIADRTLLEFFRAYTGPLKQSIEDTLEIVRYYQNSAQFTILTATEHTNQLTFELAEQAEAKSGKIFDLNILAMAIENEIDILLTKNVSDYPQTGLINIVDPT